MKGELIKVVRFVSVLLFVAVGAWPCVAAGRVDVAVLDFGETETGRRAADLIAAALQESAAGEGSKVALVDRGLARAAARGAGYGGSLNLTLAEARDLGAAVGCDLYVTGDAQTLRRSSLSVPVYYEAYASVFVVSARTGRLVMWERPAAEAATPEAAEAALASELAARARGRYREALVRAFEREEGERLAPVAGGVGEGTRVIDLSTDAETGARADVRDPVPYRRVRPPYPPTAERAEAEATVDAAADIAADGTVARVEIVRWAGFGLDDAVLDTVRRLHFRPAERDGAPVAVRVLLRYNFRKPTKAKS